MGENMGKWISVNLTWDDCRSSIDEFDKNNSPPNLDKEVIDKFGKTSEDLQKEMEELCKKNKKNIFYYSAKLRREEELSRKNIKSGLGDAGYYFPSFDQKFDERMKNHKNPVLKAFYYLDKQQREIEDFMSSHPKTKRYYKKMDKYEKENKLETFCGLGLNKPGTLIEVELENKELKRYFIGDINGCGGGCDHCLGISKSAIIKQYKIVWSSEEP